MISRKYGKLVVATRFTLFTFLAKYGLTFPKFVLQSRPTRPMLDQIDRSILSHLQADGRKSYTEIARALGVTEGTVRKRAAKLVEDDVIRIIGLVDPHKVGFEAPAIIQVTVAPPHLDTAAQAIKSFPEVSYLLMVSGEYDLMVEVRCRDRHHLADFIRDNLQMVDGVQKTVSTLVLHTYKLEEVDVERNLSVEEKEKLNTN